MRISDWSSDVCSSDLSAPRAPAKPHIILLPFTVRRTNYSLSFLRGYRSRRCNRCDLRWGDRKSVVWGKSVSVRLDLGGRRIIKTTNKITAPTNTDTYITQCHITT